jgi:hypothetical protein
LTGSSAYERSLIEPEAAARYLLAETLSQGVLFAWVVVLALLVWLSFGIRRAAAAWGRDGCCPAFCCCR